VRAVVVVLGCALFVALVVASVWWALYQYDECRDFGHTVLYCLGRLD